MKNVSESCYSKANGQFIVTTVHAGPGYSAHKDLRVPTSSLDSIFSLFLIWEFNANNNNNNNN